MGVVVELSGTERLVAKTIGDARFDRARKAGRVPTGTASSDQDGRGVLCELAVAKWLGVYLIPSYDPDAKQGDVGNLQVRGTRRLPPLLHVRPAKDNPADPYVLVAWHRPGVVEIVGWEWCSVILERGTASDAWQYPTRYMAGAMLQPPETISTIFHPRERA